MAGAEHIYTRPSCTRHDRNARPHAPAGTFTGSVAVAGYLYSSLFDIYYAWNQLDEASDALRQLLQIAQDGNR